MNILLIGSGGREHALAWAIAKSPKLEKLYCAPGNGGMAAISECVEINAGDHSAVIGFCRDHSIDLIIVGPEAPLVDGLEDDLTQAGFSVFGPSRAAAQLEGSKGFTKDLCAEFDIPTAAYGRFTDVENALAYARQQGAPIVVKADGLAAGKGVIMAETLEQAETAIKECFDGRFGDAGSEVVIEEWLIGEEASFFALCNGETVVPLIAAQDHKRAYDGDAGPNTGGMGAYSPAPIMTQDMMQRTMDEIIIPTAKAMVKRDTPYKGVLYAGLMITEKGPQLIEYNVRFGDPECQILMLLLKSDIVPALAATANGNLETVDLEWHDETALTVVMASKGYPGSYEKGTIINGLDQAASNSNIEIFHAGTKLSDGQLLATGGRVLNITARGTSVIEAQTLAYEAIRSIDWPGGYCRTDIGWRAVEREKVK